MGRTVHSGLFIVDLFPFVVIALEHISEWNDTTSTDAKMLHKAMDSEFIISLQVIKVKMRNPFFIKNNF